MIRTGTWKAVEAYWVSQSVGIGGCSVYSTLLFAILK
jgi:hypothetical protein